jgi:L-2-hydroxyglutarate oxidase LhgO
VTEVAIVGAGVVGLAAAAALARRGHAVTVIERHRRVAEETSSRNSGVIHSGLYYPAGSLKAQTCVAGRERLYARCVALGIPHRKVGKLVVATTPEEVALLESLRVRGLANGAGALELLDGAEVTRREPRVRALAALFSPETGIVDPAALAHSYLAEAKARGATLVLATEVLSLERRADRWALLTRQAGGETFVFESARVVNAAGLGALALSPSPARTLHPCKGDYFSVTPSLGRLASHLVYPVPGAAGLGIHLTFDLGGRFRLGPDAEYVAAPRHDVDPGKAKAFAAAAARFFPELRAEHLTADYAGIRPKLQGPGGRWEDFVIEQTAPGLLSLFGIESPGLTAAGEIAERVAERVAALG